MSSASSSFIPREPVSTPYKEYSKRHGKRLWLSASAWRSDSLFPPVPDKIECPSNTTLQHCCTSSESLLGDDPTWKKNPVQSFTHITVIIYTPETGNFVSSGVRLPWILNPVQCECLRGRLRDRVSKHYLFIRKSRSQSYCSERYPFWLELCFRRNSVPLHPAIVDYSGRVVL